MKKIIVSILLLLPLGVMAQNMKIAVVNTQEVFNVMPEVSTLENEVVTMTKQYEDELKVMQDEYNRKYSELTAQGDTLTENIKKLRLQEIQDIEARIGNFVPMAQEAIQKKREELIIPIQEKINKAIKAVGDENSYTYILVNNPQIVLYSGSSAIDVTDKVKAKLGL